MKNNSIIKTNTSIGINRVVPLTTEEWKKETTEENNSTETKNMSNNESIVLPSELMSNYLNILGVSSSPQFKSASSDSDSDDDINPFIAEMRRTQNKKIAASFVQQVKSGTTNDGSLIHHSLTMRQPEIVEVVTKRKSMTKGLCCSIL